MNLYTKINNWEINFLFIGLILFVLLWDLSVGAFLRWLEVVLRISKLITNLIYTCFLICLLIRVIGWYCKSWRIYRCDLKMKWTNIYLLRNVIVVFITSVAVWNRLETFSKRLKTILNLCNRYHTVKNDISIFIIYLSCWF